MSIFTIADLHLSLGVSKPMDIFSGWDNYVEKLKENWFKKVRPDDTVVIAGDVSWALRIEEAERDFDFIDSLPGKKIIIKGNHDYWWSTVKKVETFLKNHNYDSISVLLNSAIVVENYCICGTRGWLYRAESENDKKILMRETGRLRRSLEAAEKIGLEPIVFMHYPPVYGTDESKDILDVLIERKVKKCYYGHIHGNRAAKKIITGDYKGINLQLVSCDYVGFSPVLVM